MYVLLLCIYLLVIVSSFEEKHPKYHNYSIIHEKEEIEGTLNPHEIFVYQIDSIEKNLYFAFRADDKKALFYIYRTEAIEELSITEPLLVRLLTFSQLNEPQTINGYVLYPSQIKYTHSLSNDNQVIILLYCSFDVPCSYFLTCFVDNMQDNLITNINLKDKQSFLFRSAQTILWNLQLPGGDDSSPVTFYLNATSYEGFIDLNEFYVNGTKIEVNIIISPSNVLYWVIAIFFVLVAALIYGTYLIYKEIKRREKAADNIEEHEELFNQPINVIL